MIKEVCAYTSSRCGFALGSGNSIPDSPEKYLAMNRGVREFRGEKF
jgi:hypothetical protein